MQTKTLGATDLELSRIGFGTYALGGNNWAYAWGAQDDEASLAAMRRGLELRPTALVTPRSLWAAS